MRKIPTSRFAPFSRRSLGHGESETSENGAAGFDANITLHGDTVSIRTELTEEQLRNVSLWYGAGLSCVCMITDGDGMPLPALGPLKHSDRLDSGE